MRGSSSKCKSCVHFFKFIPPGLISQMSIPISFRKYLKRKKNNKTAMLQRGCQKWPVKIDDDWVFGDGWEKYVRQNGVQDLDIVVFKHEGNMVFDTMVFDTSWCEREYPTNDQITKDKAEKACSVAKSLRKCKIDTNSLKKITKGKDTYTITRTSSSFKFETGNKLTRCSPETELRGPSTTNKRLKSNSQSEKDDPDSSKKSTKSLLNAEKIPIPEHNHYPYFTGTLKSEYVLNLPTRFSRSNGLCVGKMILKNGQTQKSWTVELSICSGVSYHIGRGWHDFYIENGIKIGDRFKLELIKNGIKPEAIFYQISTKPSEFLGTVETEGLNSHRFFVGTLKQYGKSCIWLYLPKKFATENGLSNGEIILKNVENKGSWTVYLERYLDDYFKLENGMNEFCITNDFTKGDRLKFELIKNGKKPVAVISRMLIDNPYFKSTATAYSIKRSLVTVPMGFARSNRLDNGNCEIVVMDEKQRRWLTRIYNSGGHIYITGLRDMWDANGLKEGDDFLLELVENGKKPLMNFKINRERNARMQSSRLTRSLSKLT